jgi:transcriptional regulator with XRE-family HTH domain
MYDGVELGNRIYFARMRKNLKQSAISQVLGISQSAFSNIETGKRDITVAELYILSDTLNVSIEWLLGLDGDTKLTYEDQLKIEELRQLLNKVRNKS